MVESVEKEKKTKEVVTAVGPSFFIQLTQGGIELTTWNQTRFTRNTSLDHTWSAFCVLRSTVYLLGNQKDPLAVAKSNPVYKGKYLVVNLTPKQSMKIVKDQMKTCAVHDALFYVFGKNKRKWVTEKYNASKDRWSAAPPAIDTECHMLSFQNRYIYAISSYGSFPKIFVLDTLDEESGWNPIKIEGESWSKVKRIYAVAQESPYRLHVLENKFEGHLDIYKSMYKFEKENQDSHYYYYENLNSSNARKGKIYIYGYTYHFCYSIVLRKCLKFY